MKAYLVESSFKIALVFLFRVLKSRCHLINKVNHHHLWHHCMNELWIHIDADAYILSDLDGERRARLATTASKPVPKQISNSTGFHPGVPIMYWQLLRVTDGSPPIRGQRFHKRLRYRLLVIFGENDKCCTFFKKNSQMLYFVFLAI